ncbi:fungal-specific transcription factor domain-containing protein [Penicillium canariense]|uniref:Fungal-specific transcription factor domain-containing protein n=1 Tax=Penicillium canariense TaxID=189055 RepID=A0A9W9LEF0_9EURO|nr:fungal-specific transcription factor domain-containing protein [Penicillium canariense]KAJ5151100.1 fungal-specific transcription factor domain-containing protein [Penicillium canariense]
MDYTDNNPPDAIDREQALIERIDQGRQSTPGLDPEMELLVKRTGSLQFTEHGQLKYFGTTSNVHFLKTAIPFQPPMESKAPGETTAMCLERAGVAQIIPREVEDHLIKLYFTWENPYFNVVDRKAFMDARKLALSAVEAGVSIESPCYSELLVNAMCSWGALFTDRIVTGVPAPLHDLFILRARALLERDIDNPTIATVQALAMMSGSEASRCRDSRGWLCDGMATQLSHHLGLHLDVEHYVQSNDMSREEANARSTAFWGTHIVNTAWSYYLGRLTMPVSSASRVPVRQPTGDHLGQPSYWENYTDEPILGLTQHIEPLAAMWEHQISLYSIMEWLQKAFYDKQTDSISQLRAHTSAITSALDTWLAGLPQELVIDMTSTLSVYLPHVLVLHMQFYEVMIFANHPFVTSPRIGTWADSRRRYLDSAKAITRIAHIYKRLWSLRRININFMHPMLTAAMVHLYVACTSQRHEEYSLAISDLGACCQAIKEASKAYELAAWQLRSIYRVSRIWHDMLESQTLEPPAMEPPAIESAQLWGAKTCPQYSERWVAIQSVIQEFMDWTDLDPVPEEQSPWFGTWMQMQQMAGVDPFSVGSA